MQQRVDSLARTDSPSPSMPNAVEAQIKDRITTFVAELDKLVRQSALEAVRGVLDTGGMAARRGRPAGSGRPGPFRLWSGFGAALVAVALAHAIALVVIIYAWGAISGAHVNPAVTFALALGGRLPWPRAVGYWIAQFAGAAVAKAPACDPHRLVLLRRKPAFLTGPEVSHA